jgi:hypothetical protein
LKGLMANQKGENGPRSEFSTGESQLATITKSVSDLAFTRMGIQFVDAFLLI